MSRSGVLCNHSGYHMSRNMTWLPKLWSHLLISVSFNGQTIHRIMFRRVGLKVICFAQDWETSVRTNLIIWNGFDPIDKIQHEKLHQYRVDCWYYKIIISLTHATETLLQTVSSCVHFLINLAFSFNIKKNKTLFTAVSLSGQAVRHFEYLGEWIEFL